MRIRYKALSHVGLVRKNNEDALLVRRSIIRNAEKHGTFSVKNYALLFVADGMGGHSFGEEASWRTLDFVSRRLSRIDFGARSVAPKIAEVIREAHLRLLSEASAFGDLGTTLCGLVFTGERIFLVNVGDSRCYRFRKGRLAQLSHDHSLREESGDPSIPGNFLTSVIGGGSIKIKIDVSNITSQTKSGDTFLLCSDGLSEYVPAFEIVQSLKEGGAAAHVALLETALAFGAPDNVSVIVAQIEKATRS